MRNNVKIRQQNIVPDLQAHPVFQMHNHKYHHNDRRRKRRGAKTLLSSLLLPQSRELNLSSREIRAPPGIPKNRENYVVISQRYCLLKSKFFHRLISPKLPESIGDPTFVKFGQVKADCLNILRIGLHSPTNLLG